MTVGPFADARACALAGYSPRAMARVVAAAETGDFAVVLVLTPERGGEPYLVQCVRDADGRHSAGGGNATEQWGLLDGDADLGWLGGWGQAEPGIQVVRVASDGQSAEVAVGDDGYFAWLFNDVPFPGSVKFTPLRQASSRPGQDSNLRPAD